MKQIHRKNLTENSTGIRDSETIKFTKNNITYQAEISKIHINVIGNNIVIYGNIYIIDSEGNKVKEVKAIEKSFMVVDMPEQGEVTIGTNGEPDMSTYVKTEDELLNITNWDAMVLPQGVTIGQVIIGEAVDFFERKMNWE